MKKKQLRERIKREIEAEAAAWEEKAGGSEELSPDDDLYARILEKAQASQEKAGKRVLFHKRPLLAVAVIVILGVAAGIGASGAKLFVPQVENRGDGDRVNFAVNNDEEYIEVTEDEAYEEIEEKLGILALRLQYKPQGMELETVHISGDMGEALMEFYYGDYILTVYENKQNEGASTSVQFDGKLVDKIEHFYLGQELEVMEIDKNTEGIFYQTQIEYGNAYYCLITDMELEEFKNIIQGLIFRSV